MAELDEKKFAVILCKEEDDIYEQTLQELKQLEIPVGYQLDIVVVTRGTKLAANYNFAMGQSNAKYKLYLKDGALKVNPKLLQWLLEQFALPQVGILGLWGSELPLDANLAAAECEYGAYWFRSSQGEIQCDVAEEPVVYQEVRALSPSFLATCVDVPWDESVGDAFLATAQCCRLRRMGYSAIVPKQDWKDRVYWVILPKPNEYGNRCPGKEDLESQRQAFLEAYREDAMPLVSILIPAYNQPEFFQKALESALAQDYGNLEIVVGDDSTDDRIKELMQPYLQAHPEIRYYHHGGPLREKGGSNIDFVLAKSRGKYVNYLFHDDLLYEGKIRRMMEHFAKDLNEEIGLVTSVRDAIDESGNRLGYLSAWRPSSDLVCSAEELGRKMLLQGVNVIGEMTTVLMPKQMLLVPELGTFGIGYFCGFRDRSMGDFSTWLELGKRGKRIAYLAESLSAFRLHPGQNSEKKEIHIRLFLDWFAFYALSWIHGIYLRSEEEFWLLWRGHCSMRSMLPPSDAELDSETKEDWRTAREFLQAFDDGDTGKAFHLMICYILLHSTDPESVARLCEKDGKTGFWRKKRTRK